MNLLDTSPAQRALARLPHLLWAAAWRAQAVHLGLFVGGPLALFWLQQLLDVVLLPLTLTGFGDLDDQSPLLLPHLQHPGCWVALAPCGWAEQDLPGLPTRAVPDGAVEPFLPLPTAFIGRHLWFVLWLAWFIHGLWRSRAHQPNQRR